MDQIRKDHWAAVGRADCGGATGATVGTQSLGLTGAPRPGYETATLGA